MSYFELIQNFHLKSKKFERFFAQKYRGILPENAKLRICSGESWDVRVEQMDDDHYYFTRGWTKFTKDMELEKLEFLVFWFAANSTFDVSVYGITGCEKESLRRTCQGLKNKQSRTRIVENEAAWTDEETKSENSNPHFEIVLNRHRSSRVCVAKHFAEAAGLIGKKKVALEYPGGIIHLLYWI
ncbi:hypothetical protein Pfo_008749 [Paulownia fortunei]|nr:hypothetical protein Pfo_008749 [Paulownia fortunei]